jgi:sodium/hydrogen antiporter
METFTTEAFVATLALIGAVIVISALSSGIIEKTGLPQVAVFLALGAALGPVGLGMLNITLESPILRVVATLSLALVLFTDALTIDIREIRQHSKLALIILGPGTLLSAFLIAVAGWGMLGLAPAAAAIIGASLASTDPVILRPLLRRREMTAPARQGLRLESGLNDVVLLPVILIAMVFLTPGKGAENTDWFKMAIDLFLLGPGAGVAIGLIAVSTLDLVRRRIGVRRDYESLYSLGVAFAAFAAAEAVHGSGFLAAFAAGLTISALDVELCDCFLEYGETTAEMALLFTFVLFGSSLIWSGFAVADLVMVAFVVLVILARPIAFLPSLLLTKLDKKSRNLIAWLGPRGLSSLLMVLLPVFYGIPGSERLFAICCLVVLFSIVVHGGVAPLVLSRFGNKVPKASGVSTGGGHTPHEVVPRISHGESADGSVAAAPEEKPVAHVRRALPVIQDGANVVEAGAGTTSERITIEAIRQLWEHDTPVTILDVRTERTWLDSETQAQGAIRIAPENVVLQMNRTNVPKSAIIAAYCT